ncbi:MAG TPA: 3-phosphoshikimate 1-carboxyvinyltransferase [Parvularculaceae bacterium]|nr:3-phosphoshikimate 1-carboxyvinyltransferase [Parvularculaceae bacterium]
MAAAGAAAGSILAHPSMRLAGSVVAPGDKSVSHRALILGAMAEGETVIRGLLEGDDVRRTGSALRALGALVERDRRADGPIWRVEGRPWRAPARALYMGNSGTGCRLLIGAAAGRGVAAVFDGDASLRSRPMGRILDPLAKMGACAASREGQLPVSLAASGRLRGADYVLPTPSAQIKSAVLLAGLGAQGETIIREPVPCRDHTERMLEAFGAAIAIETEPAGGRTIRIDGGQSPVATAIDAPGDPSSAAFLVAAALIVPDSDILVRGVLVNPLRAGFYETAREMGADLSFENQRLQSGEPVADIRARTSSLRGVEVPANRAASMIDEYPILSVLAAFAEGETLMAGVEELRVKESDRIAACEAGLAANGVKTESGRDWLRVFGRAGDVPGGGRVATRQDHRIAMSFLVMGLAAKKAIEIDDGSMIGTSFPDFFALMRSLGAAFDAPTSD